MFHLNIVRAWKDPDYRHSLGPAERALLPDHPAGLVELTVAELNELMGGVGHIQLTPPISNDCHILVCQAEPRP